MKKIVEYVKASYIRQAVALLICSALFESDNALSNQLTFYMLVGLGIIACIVTDEQGKHYWKVGIACLIAGALSLVGVTTAMISAAFTIAAIMTFVRGHNKACYKNKEVKYEE